MTYDPDEAVHRKFVAVLRERRAAKHQLGTEHDHDQLSHAGGSAGVTLEQKVSRFNDATRFGADTDPNDADFHFAMGPCGIDAFGLPQEQANALRAYTGDSRTINRVAAGVQDVDQNELEGIFVVDVSTVEEAREQVLKPLDSVIYERQIDEDVIVHRGFLSGGMASLELLQPGDTIATDAYVSTAVHPYGTEGFVDTGQIVFSDGKERWAQITSEILLPAGSHAAYLDDVSAMPGEYELLLPRGTSFEVIERVEVIGPPGKPQDTKIVVRMVATTPANPKDFDAARPTNTDIKV